MKRVEFDNLKIGDVCVCKRGYDQGRLVMVRYIEDEQILIKAIDNQPLRSTQGRSNLRLTGWHELDIAIL